MSSYTDFRCMLGVSWSELGVFRSAVIEKENVLFLWFDEFLYGSPCRISCRNGHITAIYESVSFRIRVYVLECTMCLLAICQLQILVTSLYVLKTPKLVYVGLHYLLLDSIGFYKYLQFNPEFIDLYFITKYLIVLRLFKIQVKSNWNCSPRAIAFLKECYKSSSDHNSVKASSKTVAENWVSKQSWLFWYWSQFTLGLAHIFLGIIFCVF